MHVENSKDCKGTKEEGAVATSISEVRIGDLQIVEENVPGRKIPASETVRRAGSGVI